MPLEHRLVRVEAARELDLAALELQFGVGQERIIDLLALAMALQRNASLRTSIAARVADSRFEVALADGGPYLVIEDGKIVSAAMAGEPASDLTLVDLRTSVEAAPATLAALQQAHRTTRAEAARVMLTMRDDAERFPREVFAKLVRWSPVVAADAYRQAALLQSIFDLGRSRVIDDPRPELLRVYWTHVHLLGHLTLLATVAQPTTWLAGMANAFSWRIWTPSFPLVRERISRLAVRGAWASCRFGTSTVDRYLSNLDAPQLLRVFDAVLALVSMATAFGRDHGAISSELLARLERRERAATSTSEQATVAAMARSARLALEAPDDAERAVVGDRTHARPDARLEALARVVDSDCDAAEIDERGMFPTILAMSKLALAPAEVFFPPQTHRRGDRWRPARALASLTRTLDRSAIEHSTPQQREEREKRDWN